MSTLVRCCYVQASTWHRQLCPHLTGRRHSLPQTRRQIGGCPLSSAAVSDQASTTLSTLDRKTSFSSADKAIDRGMSTLFRCCWCSGIDQTSTTLSTLDRKTSFASADKATDRGMSTLFRCS
ncbi:uncharacterized protein [Littorina saxatilis]|uniref:uncharacterized protein n=1 Tax=Littorina saxatilis TaxID=31220 RepID=UPI0038B51F47